jgi:hypothetical protein
LGITEDGANGAILCWADLNKTLPQQRYFIMSQRLNAQGARLLNPPAGIRVCTEDTQQSDPTIVSDGSSGAIIAWSDFRNLIDGDLFAQRVNGNGDVQWPASGLPVCLQPRNQWIPRILADGSGGAIVTWSDERDASGTTQLYAQRLTRDGFALWKQDGTPVSTAAYAKTDPAIVSDGRGGALLAWRDTRSFSFASIYAQRIERFGFLGDPEPVLSSVRDVPNDQGGHVKLSWYASYLDADPDYSIARYQIWRSVPPNVVSHALRDGALLPDGTQLPSVGRGRVFRRSGAAAHTIFWEFVGEQAAAGDSGYSYVAATMADSESGSNPVTLFRIQAQHRNAFAFWDSAPDSGYSVDNLPPHSPGAFTAAHASGVTHLHWARSPETDLAGYRLYRGSTAEFAPQQGNLISAQPDTGFTDAANKVEYYKLTAVDLNSNESVPSLLTPEQISGDESPAQGSLALSRPSPNPARDQATFSISLPREGIATLALYDMSGRRVRTMLAGHLAAGEHTLVLDLRDEHGAWLASGIYNLRLTAAGKSANRRLVVVP